MNKHQQMTKEELIRCIKALENGTPATSGSPEEDRRLLHELEVRQIDTEAQNRELHEARQLFEGSRDRYADLYDFAPVGYVTLDDKNVIREINLTAAGMLGVERTRLVGAPFHVHVVPEDLALFREHLAKLSNPQEGVTTELRLARKSGCALPVLMQSMLVYEAEKKGYVCRTALTDITRRKQAEEALSESERRFRHLVETTMIIAWEGDVATWRFTYVSAWAEEVLGYPLKDWFKDGFWVDHIDPEDREAVVKCCAEKTSREDDFELEFRMVRADGRKVWFHDIVHVVQGATGPETFKGFLIDITERKKAEEALREANEFSKQVIGGAQAGIVVYNREGRFVVWNPFMEQLTGYRSEEVLGRRALEAFPFLHEQHFEKMFERALAGEVFEAPDISFDLPQKGKRGWTAARFAPLRDARQEIVGVIVAVRDITERRRLEAELLEISDRERKRIGHDLHDGLGQRLTALEMKCFLLLEDLAANDLTATRRRLQKQTRHVSQALRECVTITRSLAHGLAPVNLQAEGLTDALEQLAHRASLPGRIACRFVCRRPVLLENSLTAGHLYRIAQEAVNNALKHARARHVHINLAHEQNVLRLQIKDDGRGLPRSRNPKSGMGLEVMRHRAHVIGASLEIDSKPGQGVTVTCTLPLKES